MSHSRVRWTPVSRRVHVHVHATISEKLHVHVHVHVHVHATIFEKSKWIPTKKLFQIPTKKQISHVNREKDTEAPEFFQVRNPD